MQEITKIFEQTMLEDGAFVQEIDRLYDKIGVDLSAEDDKSMNLLYEYTLHIMESAFCHGVQSGFRLYTELNK